MKRNKLYVLLGLACVAGYVWLALNISDTGSGTFVPSGCMVKHLTNVPCPSCGSTRSVMSLVHGDILGALKWNPLGIILFLIMAVVPLWLMYDLLSGKSSLHRFYLETEARLRQRSVAIPLVILVMANWAWNIYKGL